MERQTSNPAENNSISLFHRLMEDWLNNQSMNWIAVQNFSRHETRKIFRAKAD
jgi:hypothetical protein